ncbi:MAG: polysaccharide lyase family 1 protein [Christensenellaceae bacterium]
MKKLVSTLIILTLAIALTACVNNSPTNDGGSNSTSFSSTEDSRNSASGTQNGDTSSDGSSQGSYEDSSSVELPSDGEISKIGKVDVLASYGGMETAYLTWKIADFDGYAVYYKGNGVSDWNKIDNELIRKYPTYYRADVLALSAGEYEIKVTPISNNAEDDGASTIVTITTTAHAREGFAFSELSPNKTASGAYNDDGTLPSNAQVLYITKENINTVTLDVIKDSKGTKITAVGLLDILYYRQKGYDKTPLSIRMIGTILDSHITWETTNVKADEFNYVNIKSCYNVTFEGVGNDATCYGWSVKIRDANNVEVRNLGFMLFKDDGVTIDTDNNNVWVHNNDFFYGATGSDSDQVKGDGSCDNKKSNYLTISYNHFWDSGKAILCGMGDTTNYYATFHHNWFDHSDSRHPRIRVGTIHVYNNYYDGVSKYGIGVTTGSSCFSEANYFLNTKEPMLSSKQGTDAIGEGTFSGETGGIIKAFGNFFDNTIKPMDYADNATSFDVYTVSDKSQTVPSSVKTLLGGTTYNNFDTDSSMYAYTPHDAEKVPVVVKAYAGRVGGGDFTWTFTQSDNYDYNLNTALKNKILAYKTSLVSVGGI